MINAKLVEHNIKDIIYFKLNECHKLNQNIITLFIIHCVFLDI